MVKHMKAHTPAALGAHHCFSFFGERLKTLTRIFTETACPRFHSLQCTADGFTRRGCSRLHAEQICVAEFRVSHADAYLHGYECLAKEIELISSVVRCVVGQCVTVTVTVADDIDVFLFRARLCHEH